MNIHHVITRMVAGGAQKNTLMCAVEQARRGHQVSLIAGPETGSEGSLWPEARESGLRLVESPYLLREVSPVADLRGLLQLTQLFWREKPDIVHTHTSKAGILGRLAARMAGVPVIVHTPHGHVFHSYFSARKAQLFKLCERLLAIIASDGLIMLSSGCLRDHLAEGIGKAPQFYIVPSGVSLDRFKQVVRQRTPSPLIGYVGRLADVKGPLYLVEAFAHLLGSVPEARLLLVGDGPQRAEVEALIERLGLTDKVEITGWQEDPAPFLARMDVLAVPSLNEGMGRVVVEAMAAGLPVVATAVGGLVDLVRPGLNGYLVKPGDARALAEALQELLHLPDRGQQLGQRGIDLAEDFSDRVMYDRLEQIYERLCRRRGIPV